MFTPFACITQSLENNKLHKLSHVPFPYLIVPENFNCRNDSNDGVNENT